MKLSLSRVGLFGLSTSTALYALAITIPVFTQVSDPGLPPVRDSLATVRIIGERPDIPGYERSLFGDWSYTPVGTDVCTTREAALLAAFDHTGCRSFGTSTDPYSLATMSADAVDIDHIVPLAAAWDLGAHSWDARTRRAFANDPLNVIATSSSVNRDKSDQLPSQWLPPSRRTHCWYARRTAAIVAAYGLDLPRADARALRHQCPQEWFG